MSIAHELFLTDYFLFSIKNLILIKFVFLLFSIAIAIY